MINHLKIEKGFFFLIPPEGVEFTSEVEQAPPGVFTNFCIELDWHSDVTILSAVPMGLHKIEYIPAVNCRAKFKCPSGTKKRKLNSMTLLMADRAGSLHY